MKHEKKILPLLDFVPALTARYSPPIHLGPLVAFFTRVSEGEEVQLVADCPPRHGKTDTIEHGVVWLLKQKPSMRVCYISHGQRISEKKSRRMLALAERARVPLDPNAQAIADWRTGVEEGGVFATSTGGAIVGEGFDVIIVDDPVRDRVSAESQRARDRLHEWFTNDVLTRLEPGGSPLVNMHRWHEDDQSGRLIRAGWEHAHLPAIDEQGRALWPERFPLEKLQERRAAIGEYAWWSLYMGEPQPRGGALFRDVRTFDKPPEDMRIEVTGVDMAYTAKKRSDYSVAVVLGFHGPHAFVLEVVRAQVQASGFRDRLAALRDKYPGARLVSYVGGQERAILDLFAESGLNIEARPAVADKFIRAQAVSAAWNAGHVLVRSSAPWVTAFVDEVMSFTGKGDRHDDQVDALAAAFDAGRAANSGPHIPIQPPQWMTNDGVGFDSVERPRIFVNGNTQPRTADEIKNDILRADATRNANPNDFAPLFGLAGFRDPTEGF